jgi:hypothetical protein
MIEIQRKVSSCTVVARGKEKTENRAYLSTGRTGPMPKEERYQATDRYGPTQPWYITENPTNACPLYDPQMNHNPSDQKCAVWVYQTTTSMRKA